jgi:hypothetical protein
MSKSQVTSVLLVVPADFRTVKAMRGRKDSTKANGLVEGSILSKNPRNSNSSGVVLHLLQSFQSLVSKTILYPESDLDGMASIDEFNRDAGWFRMDKLYRMACKHVKDLDEVCNISTSLREMVTWVTERRKICHTLPILDAKPGSLELVIAHIHHIPMGRWRNLRVQCVLNSRVELILPVKVKRCMERLRKEVLCSAVQCPVLTNAVGAERDGEISLITTPSHKAKNGS